jgi:adenosylhomocysteine nucleosidase
MSGRAADSHSSFSHSARLALIVPLALERQCLSTQQRAGSGTAISVSQSGQGALNAARAAQAAVQQGATALMSVGVAGGLVAELSAGDVVIPDAVIDAESGRQFECSTPWAEAMRLQLRELGDAASGRLLSVSDVLVTPAEKANAATRFGALACDMESAAVAAVAQEHQTHFAAVRVISDALADELPSNVGNWVDGSGNARVKPVLGAMISPGRWRSVISMSTRFRLAQRRLRQLSEHLVRADYCCPRS